MDIEKDIIIIVDLLDTASAALNYSIEHGENTMYISPLVDLIKNKTHKLLSKIID